MLLEEFYCVFEFKMECGILLYVLYGLYRIIFNEEKFLKLGWGN